MFCTQCGHQIPDESQFCPECGSKVAEVPNSPQPVKPADRPSQDAQPVDYFDNGGALSPASSDDGICPKCGSHDCEIQVQQNVTGTTTNYRAGAGCLGFLLTGPFGLLCGLCGTGGKTTTTHQSMWVCKKCGHQFLTREGIVDQIKGMFFVVGMLLGVGGVLDVSLIIMLLSNLVESISNGWHLDGDTVLMTIVFAGIVLALVALPCIPLIKSAQRTVQQHGYNTIEEYLTQEEMAEVKKNFLIGFVICGVVVCGCFLISM